MRRLLVTGFEPFLDFKINPTEEIAKLLDGSKIGDFNIHGRILPVDFKEASNSLFGIVDEIQPEVIILLGLAAGRNRITPERIAINVNDSPRDNSGYVPQDEPIIEGGPDGYFSKLPIRNIVEVLNENGFPAAISNTAGTYLCNHVMYQMLHRISVTNQTTVCGFIHLPASHELAIDHTNLPSWSMEALEKAVRLIIKTC